MISKEMYDILSHIPRFDGYVSEEELESKCAISAGVLRDRLGEAQWPSHDYANECSGSKRHHWFLTENGQAAIEEYEHAKRADNLVRWSLAVSIIAALAGIGSAIASAIMLLG